MKKSKLLKIAISVAVISTIFMGCGSKTAKGEGSKYLIATDSKYAPFSFEEGGQYKGIDVEILSAAAEAGGFSYELKPMDFNGIIPAITSNQIDGAIAGMSITDDRKKSLDFSDGYFESGLSIVVKGDNSTINGENDLDGKTVSVKKGTAGEKWAMDNEAKHKLTIKHFDDSPSMFMELENGGADFALEDYPVIAYKVKLDNDNKFKIAGDKVTTAQYGFAVNKGQNADLMSKFQDGLKKIKENGKYDEIMSKYLK